MKKCIFLIVLLVTIFSFSSCSTGDDSPTVLEFRTEVMPIDSVVMPEQFVHGETYTIGLNYTKPNSCYQFSNIVYDIDGHEKTVVLVNTVYTNSASCNDEPEQVTVDFELVISGTETYLFKFYQGADDQGIDQYYLVEVPVVDGRFNSAGKD
jgi:hypothetical protein